MAALLWDQVGERFYETGVDRGVLYVPDVNGDYVNGYAWNGLTNVTETPTGAEATAQYADNIKYLNLISAEEFTASLEAFTWPEEFNQFDGQGNPEAGVYVGQQIRNVFGLSYRTIVGNDQAGNDYGYKLHLVYGAQAAPSERSFSTINDTPEPIGFSWEITTTPVAITGYKPTAILTIESSKADATGMAALQDLLWGTAGTDPSLPLPDAVVALFTGTATQVTPTEPSVTGNDITIPSITGVEYHDVTINSGDPLASGTYTITQNTVIEARPGNGYYFPGGIDTDWYYTFA
jgi:hypothetical protein